MKGTEMQELIEAAETVIATVELRLVPTFTIDDLKAAVIAARKASEGGWIDNTPDYLLGRCIPFLDTAAYYGNKEAKELRGEIVNYTFDLPSPPLSVDTPEVHK